MASSMWQFNGTWVCLLNSSCSYEENKKLAILCWMQIL